MFNVSEENQGRYNLPPANLAQLTRPRESVFHKQSSTHATSTVVFSDQSYTTRPRQSSSPINPIPLNLDLVSRLLQSILHCESVFSNHSYTHSTSWISLHQAILHSLDLAGRLLNKSSNHSDLVNRLLQSILDLFNLVNLPQAIPHQLDLVNQAPTKNPPLTRPRQSIFSNQSYTHSTLWISLLQSFLHSLDLITWISLHQAILHPLDFVSRLTLLQSILHSLDLVARLIWSILHSPDLVSRLL